LREPKHLATGGFGSIWEYSVDGCPSCPAVVVKAVDVVEPSAQHEPRMERLREAQCELKLLKHLKGSGFVRYYDSALLPIKSEAPAQLILMEAADEDLASFMRVHQGVLLEELLDMFDMVAASAERLESEGFQHRDLKPHNILVSKDRASGAVTIKVADLGLACHLRHDVGPCKWCQGTAGTANYRPPESYSGAPHPRQDRLDTWALGLVLYEMLVGVLPNPIRDATDAELGGALQNFSAAEDHGIQRRAQSHGSIGTEVSKVLVEMLERNPRRRPSVAEVRRSLRIARSGSNSTPPAELHRPFRARATTPVEGESDSELHELTSHIKFGQQELHDFSLWFNIMQPAIQKYMCCCPGGEVEGVQCKLFHRNSLLDEAGKSADCANRRDTWTKPSQQTYSGCEVRGDDIFGS